MKLYISRFIDKGILLLMLFIPGLVFSQYGTGKVFSSETNEGIGFVNIGIIGKDVGTVSDEHGNYKISLDNIEVNDTLRFSMIGYKSKTFAAGYFIEDSVRNVFLEPLIYNLQEVEVLYHKPFEIRIGTSVTTDVLRSGFASNDLGSELGIKVNVRRRMKLKDLHLNVAVCTVDSVTYRLNIYQSENGTDYKNILTKPIYISFTKDEIKNLLTFDLREYSIIIEGNVIIALELYKDLGEDRLLFRTEFFTGYTWHRKSSEDKWAESAGVIGLYLHGQTLKY